MQKTRKMSPKTRVKRSSGRVEDADDGFAQLSCFVEGLAKAVVKVVETFEENAEAGVCVCAYVCVRMCVCVCVCQLVVGLGTARKRVAARCLLVYALTSSSIAPGIKVASSAFSCK